MPILITVKDRCHDGSTITIFTRSIIVTSFDDAVEKAIALMGDYSIAEF